ncbi:MAG: acyl-CoA ligase (AMP-forming), exosortase A system-associated [Fuerstiella sp.]|nr:acyl-CoA ligase (AMP-forming), exosortase A system-associated [Fuerstiella sp.]MCP4854419.1 acyl-CoA ligase (AMP-forming), exosortase A system-associated [Fuerstiella sp.]
MDYLIHHMLRGSALRFPDKEALIHKGQRLTYQQLSNKVSALANGLNAAGIQRGDRVGILLDSSVEQVVSIFAASQAQGVFVPMHHSLKPEQVSHIANDCRISALITTTERLHELHEVIQNSPSLRVVIAVGDTIGIQETIPLLEFDDLPYAPDAAQSVDVSVEKDLGAILYTSGSTGKPKGVMLSHANVVAGASIVSEYLSITDGDRLLAALPFSFDAGLNQLTTSIQQGGTLVLINFRFAREIVGVLKRERITGLGGVPPLWNLLVQNNSALARTDLPDLRYITNTGGAMPQKTLAALRSALPNTQVFLMYGLTEAFRSTYLPPDELDRRPTSMGKAIPNTEILVINKDGRPCESGETGELVHHGPTVSMGYWGHEELTNKVLRPHPLPPPGTGDAVRVVYSGDMVRQDEDGFLYFVGRRDNLIKTSGFRVSPNEVEDAIFQTGQIREAAIIGVPDEMLGQHIAAFVVLKDGEAISEADLLTSCAASLPRHMVPRTVEFLPLLPKTSSGKVNYSALRQQTDDVKENLAAATTARTVEST